MSFDPDATLFPSGLTQTDLKYLFAPSRSLLPCRFSLPRRLLYYRANLKATPPCLETDRPQPLCPIRLSSALPVPTFQTAIVWSYDPEARLSSSGLKQIEKTVLDWPLRVPFTLPVAKSRTTILPASDPEASFSPSGPMKTDWICRSCPFEVCSHLPVAASMMTTVLSSEPEASFSPSGLKQTELT